MATLDSNTSGSIDAGIRCTGRMEGASGKLHLIVASLAATTTCCMQTRKSSNGEASSD